MTTPRQTKRSDVEALKGRAKHKALGLPRGVFVRDGEYWIRYVDANRKEHKEKIGKRLSLAVKVYQKRKTEIIEGRFFPRSPQKRDIIIDEFVATYLQQARGTVKGFKDYERYGAIWTARFKGRRLRTIAEDEVEAWKQQRRREVSPASVNRELAFLKHIFNLAIPRYADINPVRRVKFFKESHRVRYLTENEEARLKQELGANRFAWPIVVLAMNSGGRRANVFRLRRNEVDFQSGVLTFTETKTGESYHVPMNETLRSLLSKVLASHPHPWVFPNTKGTGPLNAQNFYNRVFKPALGRAGIKNFKFHDFRHTFASRLVMQGRSLYEVKELLGHKRESTTHRYAHLAPDRLREAVNSLVKAPTGTTTGTDVLLKKEETTGSTEQLDNTKKITRREG
jgi:integrase